MQLRTIKSFVKRTGRMSKAQKLALEQYSQDYMLDWQRPLAEQVDLTDYEAIILEIGFGMGASFLEMARQQPNWLFIGVEVHTPGVGEVLSIVAQEQLSHVRVYHHDAVEVLQQSIPDNALDKVQVFFPDPWPKKRHHKRRLLKSSFIEQLYPKLKPKGLLHIATDWLPYAQEVQEMMQTQTERFLQAEQDVQNSLHLRVETKYERRGERLGHQITDLLYQR